MSRAVFKRLQSLVFLGVKNSKYFKYFKILKYLKKGIHPAYAADTLKGKE